MVIKKVQDKLIMHDGKCPVCLNFTRIENEGSNWLSEGKVQLRIMCDCGLEFYATCEVKDTDCEMEEEILNSLD